MAVATFATLSLLPFAGAAEAAPSSAELRALPASVLADLSAPERVTAVRALAADDDAGAVALSRYVDGQLTVTRIAAEAGKADELAGLLAAQPSVTAAAVDVRRHITAVTPSNDPGRSKQWALNRLQAESVRAEYTAAGHTWGQFPVVAVIDTGVQSNHPDLVNRTVAGVDFVVRPHQAIARAAGKSIDQNGHGTHVAGIVGATVGNTTGVAGLLAGARIMPVRVLDANGEGYDSDIAAGVIWAVNHGAKVLNLSLGGPDGSTVLQDVATYARNHGALFVAASGNDGATTNALSYPCAYTTVLCVAATTQTDAHANFSTHGPQVDVAAPGAYILSTYNQSQYGFLDGTSMATPYAAATAAIAFAAYPGATVDATRARIVGTAEDLGAPGVDNFFGAGLVDPLAIMQAAPPTPPRRPTGLRYAPAASGKAVVTFNAPTTPGYATVTGYRVRVGDLADVTVSASARSATVPRPVSGTSYEVSAVALSVAGASEPARFTLATAATMHTSVTITKPAAVARGATSRTTAKLTGRNPADGQSQVLAGVPVLVYAGPTTTKLAKVGTVVTNSSGVATYSVKLTTAKVVQFRFVGRAYPVAPSTVLASDPGNSPMTTAHIR